MYVLIGYRRNVRTNDKGENQVSFNFYLASPVDSRFGEGQEVIELWQPESRVSFSPKVGNEYNAIIGKRGQNFYIDHIEPATIKDI